MKNCVGIAELLCAYADNELSESNRRLVEDHLIICENCSAILKLYKEISDSVNDTNVPAPDALCIGVMNRIQNEEAPQKVTISKKRRRYQYILTRYAPIAACLVVVFLVWQFWTPLSALLPASSPASDNMLFAAPEAAMAGGDIMPTNELGPEPVRDVLFDNDGGDSNEMTDDSLESAPQAGGRSLPLTDADIAVSAESLIKLTIIEDSLTPAGTEYIISNECDDTVNFHESFGIQVLVDETWFHVVTLISRAFFNDIIYTAEPGETHNFQTDWSSLHGNLPEGTYRLVKSITYANSDEPAFYIAGEFTIG